MRGTQGTLPTLHEPWLFLFLVLSLYSAMSSEQNKKLFLQQVEQILDGIKQERAMVGGGYKELWHIFNVSLLPLIT